MTKEIETTIAGKILFFLLCAIIILTTLAYGTVHQPTLAVFYTGAATVVVLWAVDALTSGVLRFNRSLLQIPLIAAAAYALVQIVPFGSLAETAGVLDIPRRISLDAFATRVAALRFLALLILLAAFLTHLDTAKRLKKFVIVITGFGFVFAFFAILQAVLSPNRIYGIYEVPYATPFGSFVNRHDFAAFMEMTVSLPLGLMFTGAVGKDRKLLFVTAIALMGIALILSGSRGGLISLLAAIFFLVILTTRTRNPTQFALKTGAGVLLVATILIGSILIGGESSLTRLAETATSQDFSTSRTYIWSATLNVIYANLPFGAGFGAFGTAFTPFDKFSGLQRVEQAHNDYLETLAVAGIIGLIIGGYFLYQLFKTGLRNAKTQNTFRRGVCVGALAGCFAILVHSLFAFVLHITAIATLFVAFVALVAVSGTEFPDDAPEEEPRRRDKKSRSAASVTSIEKGRRTRKRTAE